MRVVLGQMRAVVVVDLERVVFIEELWVETIPIHRRTTVEHQPTLVGGLQRNHQPPSPSADIPPLWAAQVAPVLVETSLQSGLQVKNDRVARDVLTRLLEPRNLADPYPLYADLRKQQPVRVAGEWIFTRYDDVSTILRDPRFGRPRVPRLLVGSVGVVLGMFLLRDPPDHTRLRRGVARVFTPAAMGECGP